MAEEKATGERPAFQPRRGDSLAALYVLWRLSEQVEVRENGCWEWTGAANDKGYGVVHLTKLNWVERTVSVHRLVYSICVEPIPDGLDVLHRCDNPPCCRPDHLFLGTNLDNIADKMAKGRHRSPKGEEHGYHKLTAELVTQIRRRAAASARP